MARVLSLKTAKWALLSPFVATLCPALFWYEYLVCQNPQLVDDVQYIPRPVFQFLKYVLLCSFILPILVLVWVLSALQIPILLLGFIVVWLLKSRIPQLEERAFKTLLLFKKIWTIPLLLALTPVFTSMFVPALPLIVCWAKFRIGVWDNVFYGIVPEIVLFWNQKAYGDLDTSKKQLRLIEILPGPINNPVECKLAVHNWNTAKYDALSYAWGGHLVLRRFIKLDNRTYLVTDSVYQALRELRHADESRLLWIDAVCINQADLTERKEQVQAMRQIYTHAEQVIVWLGRAPQGASNDFKMFRKLEDHTNEEKFEILSTSSTWKNVLTDITTRKWWTRVWVLQEVVANKNVIIRVGKDELTWQAMSSVILFCNSNLTSSFDVHEGIHGFIKVVSELQSTSEDPRFGLLQHADTFRNRQATDARDKLYALIGLLKDPWKALIEPNYQPSSHEVFADFTANCIAEYKSLAILALAEQSPTTGTTWAVDWNSNNIRYRHPFWSDELVTNSVANTIYCSDGGKEAVITRWPGFAGSIGLNGFEIDEIAQVGGSVPQEWERQWHEKAIIAVQIDAWASLAGGPWTEDSDPQKMAFIRTITCDPHSRRDISGFHLDSKIRFYLTHVLKSSSSTWNDEANVTMRIEAYEKTSMDAPQNPSTESPLNARIKQCCRRRQFFITKSGKRFGLGPIGIKTGDRVVVLFGSRVPLILRPEKDAFHSRFSSWINSRRMGSDLQTCAFIGQAYVDGKMAYEANAKHYAENGEKMYHLI
jgi:hypothetical protein